MSNWLEEKKKELSLTRHEIIEAYKQGQADMKESLNKLPLFRASNGAFTTRLSGLICNTVGSYLCMGAKEKHPNENSNDKEIELCNKLANVIINKIREQLEDFK